MTEKGKRVDKTVLRLTLLEMTKEYLMAFDQEEPNVTEWLFMTDALEKYVLGGEDNDADNAYWDEVLKPFDSLI